MASRTSPIPNSSSTTRIVCISGARFGPVRTLGGCRWIDAPAKTAEQSLHIAETVTDLEPVLAEREFAQDRIELVVPHLQDRDQPVQLGMQLDIAQQHEVFRDG